MAPKKRSPHEGSISQRSNGTWRGQITFNGKRSSITTKTKKEANDWLLKMRVQQDAGGRLNRPSLTLSEYLEEWLVSIESSLRPGTFYQYQMTVRKHILPSLGKWRMQELRGEYIQRLYVSKTKEGRGNRTVEMIHAVLHNALKQAVKLEIINRNPVDGTTPPHPEYKEMRVYDGSQVSQFLLAARGNPYEMLYYLAVTTGMRQSELLGLTWSSLDWEKKIIRVQWQLKRNFKSGSKNYFVAPKTNAGRRTIALGEDTVEKLRNHLKQQEEQRKLAGDKWEENDLIFPSEVGTPINQSNLFTRFKRLLSVAGLPEIRFHDLRHTNASLLLNYGTPPIIVSHRLGHSKVSITLDIYGHLIPEMQNEAAEKIEELITPIEVGLHPITPKMPTAKTSANPGSL